MYGTPWNHSLTQRHHALIVIKLAQLGSAKQKKSRILVVLNVIHCYAIVSCVTEVTKLHQSPSVSKKAGWKVKSLNQLLFISASTVKYKALAWPPIWHLQHSKETKKDAWFIVTKWNTFDSQKLTQKKFTTILSVAKRSVQVRSKQRACFGEWKILRRLSSCSFLCSRSKTVQGRKEANVCGLY